MTRRAAILLLLLAAWPSGLGAAHHPLLERSHQPETSPPWRVQQAGVSVEVQMIGAEEATDIFGVKLVEKGVQPLMITIRNESEQTYRFRKADVDARSIPAATAARLAYDNPLLVGGRLIGRVVTSVSGVVIHPTSRRPSRPRPVFNRAIREVFVKEEIADADVGPKGSLEGFIFVRPLEPGATVRVRLLNVTSQEPLVFEVPAGGASS